MDFLRKNIEVHNIKRTKGGVRVYLDEPLKKGTGLYMSFPDAQNVWVKLFNIQICNIFLKIQRVAC